MTIFFIMHSSFLFFIDFQPPTGNNFVIDIYDIQFINRGLWGSQGYSLL